MKSFQQAAPAEISALKKRATRSLAMDSIKLEDWEFILQRLNEIENYVCEMPEGEGNGKAI